ncbi:MAG: cytochrome c [Rhodospirillaceae bacterium]|jgi:mono/diheme cytochrome c family protein|nr:cytochrome c [Rhodospirillaceae bacterium]MBT4489477.1 cytochrome c [Rhodospirillaceae bacterium]MBT5191118.1 cytochrome c [Rhodospirillaceae bacterium]MBT5894975.1 cytochrome c [Rhodospirillaceae bacterium]MBT6426276.1 cytochrome c [Rhodospirillaceae bacterium]
MKRFLIAIILISAIALLAMPSYGRDATAGHKLAAMWCSQCHVIDAGQKMASDAAPPFIDIANDPAKSSSYIAAWLADPHPPMPKMNLTKGEIDNIAAYFEKLKTD